MAVYFAGSLCFAQEAAENILESEEPKTEKKLESKKVEWTFDLTTDFAYYFKTKYKTGDHHFAQVTGPFSSVEVRTNFGAYCHIPTPLGKHFLLNGANLVVAANLEISPITLMPMLGVSWSPVPFLTFSTGASFGIGWNMLGFKGISILEDAPAKTSGEYEDLTTFKNNYYDFWTKASFQFDTGALVPGDWTHVLFVASYQLIYKGLTGVDDGNLWIWQTGTNYANGLQYSASALLGYQMPLFLKRVGLMADFYGHYNASDFGDYDKNGYDGGFMNVNLAPFVQLELSKKDSLLLLGYFSNRRSFEQEHDNAEQEPYLISTGHEWYFKRIAVRWQHFFN